MNSPYVAIFYFGAVILFLYADWKHYYAIRASDVGRELSGLSTNIDISAAINQKLDLFFRLMASDVEPYVFVIVIKLALFLGLYLLAVFVSDKLSEFMQHRSFIILNQATQNIFENYNANRQLWTTGIAIAFVVNVLATLFVNPIVPMLIRLIDSIVARLP